MTMPENFKLTMEIYGFDRLTRKFRTAPKWLGDEMTTAMRQSALAVQRESAILAPVDTGRLRQSIATEVDKADLPLWAKIGPAVMYGRYVEFGRKAGSQMPPVSALLPWVKRHGMPPAAAFAIARAIARRGIPARPYMQPGLKNAKRAIDRIQSRTMRAIELRWGRV